MTADSEISTIATFGEDRATDAEEDCWIVLGDVVEAIVNRASPQARTPCPGNVVAFPGRAPTKKGAG